MTPEQLLKTLKEACGGELAAVVLYGSSAAGDNIPGKSDSNVMLVLKNTGLSALKAVACASKAWMKKGNPPPLVFSTEQLRSSADTFPIEFADMKEFHKTLFGEDPLADMRINPAELRLALEREFKGKLVLLRESYIFTGGDRKALAGLIAESLSPFLVLCRAALRLYADTVPASKLECVTQLRRHAEFDAEIFRAAHEIRAGGSAGGQDIEALFDSYLAAIEQLCRIVDKWKAGAS
jgi:hypothetical protein